MAELQIGGLFTPATIRGAAGELANAVKTLSEEIFTANDVPGDFEDEWDQFSQEFATWRAENTGLFSSILNSTRDELSAFVERYQVLHSRWLQIDPQSGAESFAVTSDSVAGALVGAGTAIGQTLTKVSFGVVALGLGILLLWYLFKRSK